jgi:hypothetical protein
MSTSAVSIDPDASEPQADTTTEAAAAAAEVATTRERASNKGSWQPQRRPLDFGGPRPRPQDMLDV